MQHLLCFISLRTRVHFLCNSFMLLLLLAEEHHSVVLTAVITPWPSKYLFSAVDTFVNRVASQ